MLARLADGYELYPEKYKPNGFIAQRALMMMADVGNQAGQAGLKMALAQAIQGPSATEVPEIVNEDPLSEGWLLKVELTSGLEFETSSPKKNTKST